MSAHAVATPAVLRAKASRARAFACQLPAADAAVARLLEFAAELEASADFLEREVGCTTVPHAGSARGRLCDIGMPRSGG